MSTVCFLDYHVMMMMMIMECVGMVWGCGSMCWALWGCGITKLEVKR